MPTANSSPSATPAINKGSRRDAAALVVGGRQPVAVRHRQRAELVVGTRLAWSLRLYVAEHDRKAKRRHLPGNRPRPKNRIEPHPSGEGGLKIIFLNREGNLWTGGLHQVYLYRMKGVQTKRSLEGEKRESDREELPDQSPFDQGVCSAVLCGGWSRSSIGVGWASRNSANSLRAISAPGWRPSV